LTDKNGRFLKKGDFCKAPSGRVVQIIGFIDGRADVVYMDEHPGIVFSKYLEFIDDFNDYIVPDEEKRTKKISNSRFEWNRKEPS